MRSKIQNAVAAFLFISAISGLVSSCKKENQAPVVVVNSPTGAIMFSVGDTIGIQGRVSDDAGLHEAGIVLVKSTGDTIFTDYPYVHDLKTYSFQYYFLPTVSGSYTLHVTAEDHMQAVTEKTVPFMVM